MASLNPKYFVVGIVALIVGVVAVTIWSWQDEPPAKTDKLSDGPAPYWCEACKKEFVPGPAGFEPDPQIVARDPSAGYRPHCPLCGAKHSGWMMVGCPSCGKWFLPPGWMAAGSPGGPEVKAVCPYCQTDRAEWYRKAGRKGGGKS